jgi:hypothetical protein
MTECDEVAATMYPNYCLWLFYFGDGNSMDAARKYVNEKMPDESVTIVDNVAQSLFEKLRKRVK